MPRAPPAAARPPAPPRPVPPVLGAAPAPQPLAEVALAPAPVDQQVLDQEGGGHHPRPVVDPALSPQLARGRVDERVTGAALGPGGPPLGGVLPGDPVILGAQGPAAGLREAGEEVAVELPPGQLAHERLPPRPRSLGPAGDGGRAGAP